MTQHVQEVANGTGIVAKLEGIGDLTVVFRPLPCPP